MVQVAGEMAQDVARVAFEQAIEERVGLPIAVIQATPLCELRRQTEAGRRPLQVVSMGPEGGACIVSNLQVEAMLDEALR